MTYTTLEPNGAIIDDGFDSLETAIVASAAPFDLAGRSMDQSVQTVFTSRYGQLLVPKFPYDAKSTEHNPGWITVRVYPDRDKLGGLMHFFARTTDDFRFMLPTTIPTLRLAGRNVGADSFVTPTSPFQVPEFIQVDAQSSAQGWLPDLYELANPVSVFRNLSTLISVTIRSNSLTDSQLRDLGYSISDSQPRTDLPITDVIFRNTSSIQVVPGSVVVQGDIAGGLVPPLNNPIMSLSLPTTGSSGERLCDAASFTASSWADPQVRSVVFKVPNGYAACADAGWFINRFLELKVLTIDNSFYGLLSNNPSTYVRALAPPAE